MKSIDPLAPGRRIEVEARAGMWVATLTAAFNGMLDRLEEERRARAVQEAERRRIARELNDEVGQVFTTMMLDSDTLARRVPEQLRPDIEELREAARQGAEDVRGIARRLRPEALDELGLQGALMALTDAVCERAGIAVTRHLEPGLPLTPEQELVIYRVAQESMTNVVRHSRAHRINVTLGGDGAGGVLLVVVDDGVGLPSSGDHDSTGLRGMRERALLVGAEIAIGGGPRGGTEVRLHLPSDELA
jgi:two-component system sensor histidine kinase UhpB